MRKHLSLAALAAALVTPARATDLPSRLPPPVPMPPPVELFSWSGAYLGANLGAGFGTNDGRRSTILSLPASAGVFANAGGAPSSGLVAFPGNLQLRGVSGGGQVGVNYQFTPGAGFVVGVEADAQAIDFRVQNRRVLYATTSGLGGFPGLGGLVPGARLYDPNGIAELDMFGTVRGRVGYALDRTFVYATGGLAYASGSGRQFGSTALSDVFRVGWTIGGGVEVALPTGSFLNVINASAVSFKVEGLYVHLERDNHGPGLFAINAAGNAVGLATPGVATLVAPGGFRPDSQFAVVRAGLNYKLGWN